MSRNFSKPLIVFTLTVAFCLPTWAQTDRSRPPTGAPANADVTFQPNFEAGRGREAREQIEKATRVLQELMDTPESAIPNFVLERAECVAVFPTIVKVAFGVGGRGGKGVVTCRDPQTREWRQPVFLTLGGGSFGAQLGAKATDLVLVGLNRSALDLFTKNRFKLGADASVAAGPVGRTASASTDLPTISTQFLSYSRSRGLFAGAALKGTVINRDGNLNNAVYGRALRQRDILRETRETPAELAGLRDVLNRSMSERATR